MEEVIDKSHRDLQLNARPDEAHDPAGQRVNVTSVSGITGWPDKTNYSAVQSRRYRLHQGASRAKGARFGVRVQRVAPASSTPT